LEDYQKNTDAELTADADQKIRTIQTQVPAFIVAQLKTAYPGDKFLQRSVKNQKILTSAFEKQMQVDVERQAELETYIDFIEFKHIIETKDNWPLFQDTLSIRLPEEKHAARYVKWFDEINRLRRVAAHPFGKSYKEEDIEILDAVFDALVQNGVIHDDV
jgi:hypothetical protein